MEVRTTTHNQRLPGDKITVVRREEDNSSHKVFRNLPSLETTNSGKGIEDLHLERCFARFACSQTHTDAVDTGIVVVQFPGQLPDKCDGRTLSGTAGKPIP